MEAPLGYFFHRSFSELFQKERDDSFLGGLLTGVLTWNQNSLLLYCKLTNGESHMKNTFFPDEEHTSLAKWQ